MISSAKDFETYSIGVLVGRITYRSQALQVEAEGGQVMQMWRAENG